MVYAKLIIERKKYLLNKTGKCGKMGETQLQNKPELYNDKKMSKLRYMFCFFNTFRGNIIMEQRGTVNNHTFVLLNFRSIILEPTIHIYIYNTHICMRSKYYIYTWI